MSYVNHNLVALAKVDTGGLNIIPFASVEIKDSTNTNFIAIFSDEGVTEITQPTTVDSNGQLSFYAPPGTYKATIAGALVKTIVISGPSGRALGFGGPFTSSSTITPEEIGQLNEYDGTDVVITIPTELVDNLGDGYSISGVNLNATNLTFDDTGITLLYPAGMTPVIAQNCPFTLIKLRSAADTWLLYGALTTA